MMPVGFFSRKRLEETSGFLFMKCLSFVIAAFRKRKGNVPQGFFEPLSGQEKSELPDIRLLIFLEYVKLRI